MDTELDQFDEHKHSADVLKDEIGQLSIEEMAELLRSRLRSLKDQRRRIALQHTNIENGQEDHPLGFQDRVTHYLDHVESGTEPPLPPVLWEDDPEGPWVTRPDLATESDSAA